MYLSCIISSQNNTLQIPSHISSIHYFVCKSQRLPLKSSETVCLQQAQKHTKTSCRNKFSPFYPESFPSPQKNNKMIHDDSYSYPVPNPPAAPNGPGRGQRRHAWPPRAPPTTAVPSRTKSPPELVPPTTRQRRRMVPAHGASPWRAERRGNGCEFGEAGAQWWEDPEFDWCESARLVKQ